MDRLEGSSETGALGLTGLLLRTGSGPGGGRDREPDGRIEGWGGGAGGEEGVMCSCTELISRECSEVGGGGLGLRCLRVSNNFSYLVCPIHPFKKESE